MLHIASLISCDFRHLLSRNSVKQLELASGIPVRCSSHEILVQMMMCLNAGSSTAWSVFLLEHGLVVLWTACQCLSKVLVQSSSWRIFRITSASMQLAKHAPSYSSSNQRCNEISIVYIVAFQSSYKFKFRFISMYRMAKSGD